MSGTNLLHGCAAAAPTCTFFDRRFRRAFERVELGKVCRNETTRRMVVDVDKQAVASAVTVTAEQENSPKQWRTAQPAAAR